MVGRGKRSPGWPIIGEMGNRGLVEGVERRDGLLSGGMGTTPLSDGVATLLTRSTG